jgi:hypothetical protein
VAEHVARTWEKRNACKNLVTVPQEKPGTDGTIILKWILKKYGVRAGFCWLRSDPVADSCEHGNEPSGSINGGEFIDQLSSYQLLKENSAVWS